MNILHLSDLHIGNEFSDAADKIAEAIKDREIDQILVTGDIFDSSKQGGQRVMLREKINRACNLFNRICEQANLSKNNILFVPGNHDYYRTEDRASEKDKIWNMYESFLQDFYQDEKSVLDSYDFDSHMVIKVDSDNKLLYLGFNSNLPDAGKGREFIGDEQIEKVERILTQLSHVYTDFYKIAFFHHPFAPFPDCDNPMESVIENGYTFSQKLAHWGVDLILHGHMHQGRASIDRERGAKFYVFTAGNASKKNEPPHTFNIIMLDEGRNPSLLRLEAGHEFKEQLVRMKDPHMEGMLKDLLKNTDTAPFRYSLQSSLYPVIEIINALYLKYETLNVLKASPREDKGKCIYLNILLFSIQWRMDLCKNAERYCRCTSDEVIVLYGISIQKMGREFGKVFDLLRNKTINVSTNLWEQLDENLERKRYYAVALMAALFTDLYMDLTYNWEHSSKRMTGTMQDDAAYKEEVKIIDSTYNLDYRHLYIHVQCNQIQQQAVAEIICQYYKQYQRLADYLSCLKLNLDGIEPRFESSKKNAIDRYHAFRASASRLIPLLTGQNIYASDLTFVRELIQNAIDAVAFREKRKKNRLSEEDYTIEIRIKEEKPGVRCFEISDHGIGMEEDVIERYFATLGRSYYKEYDCVTEEPLQYNSISNFGIGFLSVFQPCDKIVVQTTPLNMENCYTLTIDKEHDYFFMHTDKAGSPGSTVTCYFKKDDAGIGQKIVDYIRNNMLDIKYKIKIYNENSDVIQVGSRMIRQGDAPFLFIPFNEADGSVGLGQEDVENCNYIENVKRGEEGFKHGMLFRVPQVELREHDKDHKGKSEVIMNAGIRMNRTRLSDIFHMASHGGEKLANCDIYINFPPNWLDIDVSREQANGFCNNAPEQTQFRLQVYQSFFCQLKTFKEKNQNISLAAVSEMTEFVEQYFKADVARETEIRTCVEEPYAEKFQLRVLFREAGVDFQINNKGNTAFKLDVEFGEGGNNQKRQTHEVLIHYFNDYYKQKFLDDSENFMDYFNRIGITGLSDERYIPVVLAACLPKQKENQLQKEVWKKIEKQILEVCTIKDCNKPSFFSVGFDKMKKNGITEENEKLNEIISRVKEYYEQELPSGSAHVPPDIDKLHHFIWTKLLLPMRRPYYEDENEEALEKLIYKNYKHLRDNMKAIYYSGQEPRISIYEIASCYMRSILEVSHKSSDCWGKEKNNRNSAKYMWVLDVGLNFVFMSRLSEYMKEAEQDGVKEDRIERLKGLKEKSLKENTSGREDGLLTRSKYNKYVSVLTMKDAYQENIDLLFFSELLQWIAEYIDTQCIKGNITHNGLISFENF